MVLISVTAMRMRLGVPEMVIAIVTIAFYQPKTLAPSPTPPPCPS